MLGNISILQLEVQTVTSLDIYKSINQINHSLIGVGKVFTVVIEISNYLYIIKIKVR